MTVSKTNVKNNEAPQPAFLCPGSISAQIFNSGKVGAIMLPDQLQLHHITLEVKSTGLLREAYFH